MCFCGVTSCQQQVEPLLRSLSSIQAPLCWLLASGISVHSVCHTKIKRCGNDGRNVCSALLLELRASLQIAPACCPIWTEHRSKKGRRQVTLFHVVFFFSLFWFWEAYFSHWWWMLINSWIILNKPRRLKLCSSWRPRLHPDTVGCYLTLICLTKLYMYFFTSHSAL